MKKELGAIRKLVEKLLPAEGSRQKWVHIVSSLQDF